MSASSPVAASSSSWPRASATASFMSSGTATASLFSSMSLPANFQARLWTRSTTPWKASASPMGSWTGTALMPRRSRSERTAAPKSACSLSIMLTTATSTGVLSLRTTSQTTSVPTSTPLAPRTSSSAASATRSALWTSPTKSG